MPGRHHLLTGVHSLIALPSAVSPICNQLDPDVAAAFPSLHAAYPLLAALALWRPALSTPDSSRPDIAVPAAEEETAGRGPG